MINSKEEMIDLGELPARRGRKGLGRFLRVLHDRWHFGRQRPILKSDADAHERVPCGHLSGLLGLEIWKSPQM